MDYLVDRETAEAEFDRFIEEMDVDADPAYMDEDDRGSFNKARSKIIRAIMSGLVVINENGEAVVNPKNSKSTYTDSLTFHERTGASLMAADGKKRNQDVARTYSMMAEMCKTHPSTFTKLVGSDIKVCESIFALLMD